MKIIFRLLVAIGQSDAAGIKKEAVSDASYLLQVRMPAREDL